MAFDYKKEYKEYYLPKDKPSIVTVPPMKTGDGSLSLTRDRCSFVL